MYHTYVWTFGFAKEQNLAWIKDAIRADVKEAIKLDPTPPRKKKRVKRKLGSQSSPSKKDRRSPANAEGVEQQAS